MAREPSAALAVSSKAARTASSAASISSALICKVEAPATIGWMPPSVATSTWLRQVGQIDAARGLPGTIKIVMDQFAALAFAKDLGKPVGGGDQTRNFAPVRRQWRGGLKFGIGDGVERIGGLGQRARNPARNRQNRGPGQSMAAEPDDDAGIDGIGLAKKRHQRCG